MTCLAVIPQLFRFFLSDKLAMNFAFNLYTIIEFALASYFFKTISGKNELLIFSLKVFSTIFIFIYIFLCVYRGIYTSFFSEIVCVNNFAITLWILLTALDKIQNSASIKLYNAENLFLIGMLAYAPITILIFSMWYYLKKNLNSSLQHLWIVHHICNTFMYVVFAIGFFVNWQMAKLKEISP
jgi:hypothetical protein